MKMQTMIATALLTVGFGLGVISTPAGAASWHNGTPKFLRYKVYRTTKLEPKYVRYGNGPWVPNGDTRRYEEIKTYKTHMKFFGHQYGEVLSRCRYMRNGNTYIIRGKYDRAIKVRKSGSNHIYANTGGIDRFGHFYFAKLERMARIR